LGLSHANRRLHCFGGDTSDNIPGVPGVGEVTACKLLEQFGSLEKIYKHLDEVKGEKLKEKLQLGKESAFMSQELATCMQTFL